MFKKIFGSNKPADSSKIPMIERYNLTLPYYSSLAISPDQNTVCFIGTTSDTPQLVACQANSLYFRWGIPVLSYSHSHCTFVGSNRILLGTKVDDPEGKIKESTFYLIDSLNGSVVTQKDVAFYTYGTIANTSTGTAYGIAYSSDANGNLVAIQTAGDTIECSTIASSFDVGQLFSPLMIGPDGDCYFINSKGLNRVWNNAIVLVAQMYGHNCAYMDPSGVVYQGGGYNDRSGDSEFFVYDPHSHTVNRVPFGREPINQILPAEPGNLLMATLVTGMYETKFPKATVMKYSPQEKRAIWSYDMYDMPPDRDALLVSVPEEGWAVVRHLADIRKISLSDGKPTAHLQEVNDDMLNQKDLMYRKKTELIHATWLPTHRLLYVVRTPPGYLGRLEVYWIGR